MSIHHIIASINHMHGDGREQARRHAEYVAWLGERKRPPVPEPRPTGWQAPDYSKPGVAEQVRKSVDEAYDAHHSIDKTRQ